MHEMGIVSGILQVAADSARRAQALRVVAVSVRIGDMCEVVPESLDFAWEVLRDKDPLTARAELRCERVRPASVCMVCGHAFEHDRFHLRCPQCGSAETRLEHGRELDIVSLDIETPDDATPDDETPDDEAPDDETGAGAAA